MLSGRVQVKSPSEMVPGMGGDIPKGPNYFVIVLLFLIPVLVFAAGLFLFWHGTELRTPYPFEIKRFSGTVEVYSNKTHHWTKITRKEHQLMLAPRDKVRTGTDSDFEFKIPDVFDVRLKASSELEVLPSKAGPQGKELQLKLSKGTMFGIFGRKIKDWKLYLETPVLAAVIHQAMFMLTAEKPNESSIGILEGSAEARSINAKEMIPVKALENFAVTFGQEAVAKPVHVSQQQWKMIIEVRDLLGVATAKEAEEQIDLRKKAGTFFKYVFDEGAFFKPDWGYANREFYEESGKVILKADFDVYPQYSYAGLYFKTRGLDLSKAHRLTFNLRATSEKKTLEQFRIEAKDRYSTVRGYAVKPITQDWRLYAFDFNAQNPTPVTEIVFVFENSRVGPMSTNGTVYIKDINIE